LHAMPLVLMNDLHHPAVLAKSIATADALSGGRVGLGLGAGWLEEDYRALGVDYDAPAVRIDLMGDRWFCRFEGILFRVGSGEGPQVSVVNETMLGQLGRVASQRGAGWLTVLLKRENAIAWMYLLFTWVPVLVLVFLVVGWLRPSWGFHSGQMAAPVVMAATVLSVATNQGFLRDPLDVRLADASAVTLILAAWLVGRFNPTLSMPRAGLPGQRRALWPRSAIAAMVMMTIAIGAAGATLLSAAELGGLHRVLEKARVVEGPRIMARGARQTMSDLNTQPPIDGWLASGDEQRELKE